MAQGLPMLSMGVQNAVLALWAPASGVLGHWLGTGAVDPLRPELGRLRALVFLGMKPTWPHRVFSCTRDTLC